MNYVKESIEILETKLKDVEQDAQMIRNALMALKGQVEPMEQMEAQPQKQKRSTTRRKKRRRHPKTLKQQQDVIDLVAEGCNTSSDIAKVMKVSPSTANRRLMEMVKANKLIAETHHTKTGAKKYIYMLPPSHPLASEQEEKAKEETMKLEVLTNGPTKDEAKQLESGELEVVAQT